MTMQNTTENISRSLLSLGGASQYKELRVPCWDFGLPPLSTQALCPTALSCPSDKEA